MNLTDAEIIELTKFLDRRKAFGGSLSVKNVHNVPDQFPNLYKRIFKTDSLENSLFCVGTPYYSDADEKIVKIYEDYLQSIS